MEQMIFNINIPELSYPGSMVTKAGHLDDKEMTLAAHTFQFENGIDYDLVITNVGEGILVTGMLKTQCTAECDRCLEDAHLNLSAEVDEYYLFEEPEVDEEAEDDENEFTLVEDESIDLSLALLRSLVMELPFIILCDEDCKGLCPHCGCNLNEEQCDCEENVENERLKESPFAILSNLELNE